MKSACFEVKKYLPNHRVYLEYLQEQRSSFGAEAVDKKTFARGEIEVEKMEGKFFVLEEER